MAQAALFPADSACNESWEQDRTRELTWGMLPGSCDQSQPTRCLAALRDASLQGAWEIQAVSTSETPQPQLLCDFQDPPVARCPVSNPPEMPFAQGQEGTLASRSAHPHAPKFKLPPCLGLSFTETAAWQGQGTPLALGIFTPHRAGLALGLTLPSARPH